MASDDRDRNFEKALAGRVRGSAGAACPDAETLAAFHERSLTPEEMDSWKPHTAACANCREILAQLEATDEIPLQPRQEHDVVSIRRDPRQSRNAYWRWLAPAGALAAGLLVWVAVHEKRPAGEMQTTKIKVAENRQPPSPAPASTNATSDREKDEKLSSPSKEADAEADKRAAAMGAPENLRAAPPQKKVEPPSKGAFAKSDRQDAGLNAVAQNSSISSESPAVGGVADASKLKQADNLEKQEQAMNYTAPAPSAQSAAGAAPRPMPQVDAKSAAAGQIPSAAPPSAAAETVDLSAGSRDVSSFRMARSRFPRLVSAPGGKVIWRLGMAGRIEQSRDAGLTWSPQTSGTTADLFLGSAPSELACWVIGNEGTILRTADGGAHWISVPSPISQKLNLIRASDALHATVWDMSRRNSFQTEDGGATWKQLAGQ